MRHFVLSATVGIAALMASSAFAGTVISASSSSSGGALYTPTLPSTMTVSTVVNTVTGSGGGMPMLPSGSVTASTSSTSGGGMTITLPLPGSPTFPVVLPVVTASSSSSSGFVMGYPCTPELEAYKTEAALANKASIAQTNAITRLNADIKKYNADRAKFVVHDGGSSINVKKAIAKLQKEIDLLNNNIKILTANITAAQNELKVAQRKKNKEEVTALNTKIAGLTAQKKELLKEVEALKLAKGNIEQTGKLPQKVTQETIDKDLEAIENDRTALANANAEVKRLQRNTTIYLASLNECLKAHGMKPFGTTVVP